MTAGPKITSAAGLRRIQCFALSADGYPTGDQSGATGYDGFELQGAKSFALTLPENQIIVHLGNDRPFATDYLPPNTGTSGEVRTAKQNLEADAVLTDTLTEEIGEMTVGGLSTEKVGSEIDVAIIAYRQALDTTRGASQLRRWQMHILPIARLVPRGGEPTRAARTRMSIPWYRRQPPSTPPATPSARPTRGLTSACGCAASPKTRS